MSGQSAQHCCDLPDALVDFSIDGQFVANGGAKVSELVDNIQFVVVDGDERWDVHFLTQHVGLFQADGEPEVFAGLGEPIHETLEL